MGHYKKQVVDAARSLRFLKGFENIQSAPHAILPLVVGTQPRDWKINEISILKTATFWRRDTGTPHSVPVSATIPQTWAVCCRDDSQFTKSFARCQRHPVKLIQRLVECFVWRLPQVGSSSAHCVCCWLWSFCILCLPTIKLGSPTTILPAANQNCTPSRRQTTSNRLAFFKNPPNGAACSVLSCANLLGTFLNFVRSSYSDNTRFQETHQC